MFGELKKYNEHATQIKILFHANLGCRCSTVEQMVSINISDCKNEQSVNKRINEEYIKWLEKRGDFDWVDTGEAI